MAYTKTCVTQVMQSGEYISKYCDFANNYYFTRFRWLKRTVFRVKDQYCLISVLKSIQTKTGTGENSKSDDKITVRICDGVNSCCETNDLDNPNKNDREEGQTDIFSGKEILNACFQKCFQSQNLEITVKMPNGESDGWCVDSIQLTTTNNETFNCKIKGWIDNGDEPAGPSSRTVKCASQGWYKP